MAGLMAKRAFYATLNEAIADIKQHGFDSANRVAHWLSILNEASRQALIPEQDLARMLSEHFGRVYERFLSKPSAFARVHPGVSRFTVANLRPRLRQQLDATTAVSADLIKLNREVEVRKTLQRFAGWASSIPVGGTKVGQADTSENVRRGISGLPYRERLVIVDQGHKFKAALDKIVAVDQGAIALIWHHVAEGPPAYDSRPDHVARDGELFVLRDNWAMKAGLMKLDGRRYYDQVTAVGQEIGCRCSAIFVYNLRDLPREMITAKGREELERVRAQIAAM